MIKYSIILPYYRRADHLHNTLLSYRHYLSGRSDYEIVLIEDRANAENVDDSSALIAVLSTFKDLPIRHLVSRHPNQLNPCRSRNEAWDESRGKIICQSNPECFLKCDPLAYLDKHFIKAPFRNDLYVVAACEDVKFDGRAKKYEDLKSAEFLLWFDHPKESRRLLHWFSAMTSEAYDKIGGFTDCYGDWNGYDDNDFLQKVRQKGMNIINTVDFLVAHIDHPRTHQAKIPFAKAENYYSRKWHKQKTNKMPIVILCFERPDTLRDMVKSIESRTAHGTYEIILCDNGSTCPKMIKLLAELEEKHTILRNGRNMGFAGLNAGLALCHNDFFIISDPDIILGLETPKTWIEDVVKVLKETQAPKVGLGLDIIGLPDDTFGKQGRENEKSYRKDKAVLSSIDEPAYYAPIDTTLAMCRRDTFHAWTQGGFIEIAEPHTLWGNYIPQMYNPKYPVSPIRLCGKYEATHGGWYFGTKYADDYRHYSRVCDMELAGTIKNVNNPRPAIPDMPVRERTIARIRKDHNHPKKMRYTGKDPYSGSDDNGNVNIFCKTADVVDVSEVKARQLMADFPDKWELLSV